MTLSRADIRGVGSKFRFLPHHPKHVEGVLNGLEMDVDQLIDFLGWVYGAILGSGFECKCWYEDVSPFFQTFQLDMNKMKLFYDEFKEREKQGLGHVWPVFDREFKEFPWSVQYYVKGSRAKDYVCTVPL